jgi:hypothetical protein
VGARRKYIWREELNAAVQDLQADLSASRAKDKRDLIGQLNREADALDAHIAIQLETPEYKALEGNYN